MANSFNVILIIIQLLILVLGIIVLLRNRKKKINKVFAALSFLYAFWVFSSFMSDTAGTDTSAFFWAQMAIIGPIFLGPLTYYFSWIFPRIENKIPVWKKVLTVVAPIMLILLVPTSYNVISIERKEWGTDFVPGILYRILLMHLIFFYGSAFSVFIRKIRNTKRKTEKKQISFLFIATAITLIIGVLTNLILPAMGLAFFSKVGPSVAILFFVFLVAYAITMESLFEIRVILWELLATLIAIITMLDFFTSDTPELMILRGTMAFFLLALLVMFVRNVTLEVKRKEELEIANAKLLKLDKVKTEFISIASHQFRTPLTSMKGFISIMKSGVYGKVPKDFAEPLSHIEIANERLIFLVEEMLNVSRLEMGKMTFDFKPERLDDLAREVCDSFELVAKEKKIKLEIKTEKNLPEIFMDYGKVREMLSNIVDNAIKYTPEGGVLISVKKKMSSNSLQVIISDTGIGISRDHIGKIFDKFSRGKRAQQLKKSGLGLGLYLGKKIAEAHGGNIVVTSRGKSRGSTFTIELPISQNKITKKQP